MKPMTNGEMMKLFLENYPELECSDYRPLAQEFVKDRAGITIWLKNGDIIQWFPGSNEKIKPCPLCGGGAKYKKTGKYGSSRVLYYIECENCKLRIEKEDGSAVIKAWNRRAR